MQTLGLPDLAGKRVLDLGSNKDFFAAGPSSTVQRSCDDQILRHVYHFMNRLSVEEGHGNKAKAYQLELVKRFKALQILARS